MKVLRRIRSLGRYWLNDWVIRSQLFIRKIRIDQGLVIVTTFSIFIILVLVTIANVIADYNYMFIAFIILQLSNFVIIPSE